MFRGLGRLIGSITQPPKRQKRKGVKAMLPLQDMWVFCMKQGILERIPASFQASDNDPSSLRRACMARID